MQTSGQKQSSEDGRLGFVQSKSELAFWLLRQLRLRRQGLSNSVSIMSDEAAQAGHCVWIRSNSSS